MNNFKQLQKKEEEGIDEERSAFGDGEDNVFYFLSRFWSCFVQFPFVDKVINEELFKNSIEALKEDFLKVTFVGSASQFTERDFKNVMNIIEFSLKHPTLVSASTL